MHGAAFGRCDVHGMWAGQSAIGCQHLGIIIVRVWHLTDESAYCPARGSASTRRLSMGHPDPHSLDPQVRVVDWRVVTGGQRCGGGGCDAIVSTDERAK